MSRSILSSVARRISRPHPACATASVISSPAPSPKPTLSFSASFCHSSYRTPAISSAPKRDPRVRCGGYRSPQIWINAAQPRSAFSSSATTSAAQVTQNPRADEDGNTLMVQISERAANVRSINPVVFMRSFVLYLLGWICRCWRIH
ncbi:hypothetical protein BJX76DRAFT_330030 [Aspergillus varians]